MLRGVIYNFNLVLLIIWN